MSSLPWVYRCKVEKTDAAGGSDYNASGVGVWLDYGAGGAVGGSGYGVAGATGGSDYGATGSELTG